MSRTSPLERDDYDNENEKWINKDSVSEAVKALPEAPGSIHVDSYINGFHVGFTKRLSDNNLNQQVVSVKAFVESLKEYGYKPSWNEDTNITASEEPKQTLTCSFCGEPATKRSGVKNGKKWAGIFCSADKNHVQWTSN